MNPISRRTLLAGSGAAVAFSSLAGRADDSTGSAIVNGRINQSVCSWCFRPMPLDQLASAAAALGCKSVELLRPNDWSVLKEHGLVCAMTSTHSLEKGLNHTENHAECLTAIRTAIEATSAAEFPNVITFSGNRDGISDEEGLANTVAALKQVVGLAEKSRVTICIEVLNSRVDEKDKGHPDYQCDRVEWAAEVCKQVGSDRVKMLFDIYHVQIMQGDVIQRIRQFKDYIGHYHTAGVPGRHELDNQQELNYPAIMKEIVASGFTGYVGQEFIPRAEDKLDSLRAAVKLCDV